MKITFLTPIVLFLLLFISCDAGEVGVFASIERVDETSSSNLPNTTPRGIVYVNGYYYASVGELYVRSEDSQWEKVTHPQDAPGQTVEALANFNGNLYASYSRQGSESSTLYYVDVDVNPNTNAINENTYTNPEWNTVDAFAGEIVDLLHADVSNLFILVKDPVSDSADKYTLHHHVENLTPPSPPKVTSLPKISDVVSFQLAYWFLSEGTLYRWEQNSSFDLQNVYDSTYQPQVSTSQPQDDSKKAKNYIGMSLINSTLYVSAEYDADDATETGVYTSDDGTTWTLHESSDAEGDTLRVVEFLRSDGDTTIYAITEGKDIYEYSTASSPPSPPTYIKHKDRPDLSEGTWVTLSTELLNGTIFFLVYQSGLWSNDFPSFSKWTHE